MLALVSRWSTTTHPCIGGEAFRSRQHCTQADQLPLVEGGRNTLRGTDRQEYLQAALLIALQPFAHRVAVNAQQVGHPYATRRLTTLQQVERLGLLLFPGMRFGP